VTFGVGVTIGAGGRRQGPGDVRRGGDGRGAGDGRMRGGGWCGATGGAGVTGAKCGWSQGGPVPPCDVAAGFTGRWHFVRGVGPKAFGSHEYGKAKEAMDHPGPLMALRERGTPPLRHSRASGNLGQGGLFPSFPRAARPNAAARGREGRDRWVPVA